MARGEQQVLNQQRVSKEQHWRDAIRQWQGSGRTIRAFCAEHHLSEHSFHAWRRTIARRDQLRQAGGGKADDASSKRRDRKAKIGDQADRPAFVPVRILAPALDTATPTTPAATGLELMLGSRRTIRVSPGFDAATLRRLLTPWRSRHAEFAVAGAHLLVHESGRSSQEIRRVRPVGPRLRKVSSPRSPNAFRSTCRMAATAGHSDKITNG